MCRVIGAVAGGGGEGVEGSGEELSCTEDEGGCEIL